VGAELAFVHVIGRNLEIARYHALAVVCSTAVSKRLPTAVATLAIAN